MMTCLADTEPSAEETDDDLLDLRSLLGPARIWWSFCCLMVNIGWDSGCSGSTIILDIRASASLLSHVW